VLCCGITGSDFARNSAHALSTVVLATNAFYLVYLTVSASLSGSHGVAWTMFLGVSFWHAVSSRSAVPLSSSHSCALRKLAKAERRCNQGVSTVGLLMFALFNCHLNATPLSPAHTLVLHIGYFSVGYMALGLLCKACCFAAGLAAACIFLSLQR
jgi:hypothetical protein